MADESASKANQYEQRQPSGFGERIEPQKPEPAEQRHDEQITQIEQCPLTDNLLPTVWRKETVIVAIQRVIMMLSQPFFGLGICSLKNCQNRRSADEGRDQAKSCG
ncbi:hypothetical protein ACFQ14_14935 [Pseudahrensia aquimaris]|uniref:Uncharacterized protein n=1 Tax=Pseudahrensia aquimaris TaxID=744461 RepID=A0ABW3FLT5_9HYPH